MTARPSQIRAHRILSFLAILHSAAVLGLSSRNHDHVWSWWWLGLATSLFLWPLVLAIHPGRSLLRFLIPTIIAAALFLPCAHIYALRTHSSSGRIALGVYQWRAAHNLEKLLLSNPRMILYSIDQDGTKPLEAKKGYRLIGVDEIILPDDMYRIRGEFVRMDEAPEELLIKAGQTISSTADKGGNSNYGKTWQILRRETNGSNEAEAEIAATPGPEPDEFDREPYKGSAVLGYAEITDRAEQRALITALASSARYGWESALCHNPRHGLYVETGTTAIDLTICFECHNVYGHSWGPNDKISSFADGGFSITDASESVFNATLKRHGIPISQNPWP